VEKEYTVNFTISDEKYIFQIGTDKLEMENKTPDKKIQKIVYPYFGGNNKAIRKMYIWAKLHKL
jgi:hypothetical protein